MGKEVTGDKNARAEAAAEFREGKCSSCSTRTRKLLLLYASAHAAAKTEN